jgi:hypothetical protein
MGGFEPLHNKMPFGDPSIVQVLPCDKLVEILAGFGLVVKFLFSYICPIPDGIPSSILFFFTMAMPPYANQCAKDSNKITLPGQQKAVEGKVLTDRRKDEFLLV